MENTTAIQAQHAGTRQWSWFLAAGTCGRGQEGLVLPQLRDPLPA